MEGFAVTCPESNLHAPDAPRLRIFDQAGFCSSPRSFGLDFLQTPPRDDALALLLAFGSAKTWQSDLHRLSNAPCPTHTLRLTGSPRPEKPAVGRPVEPWVRLRRNIKTVEKRVEAVKLGVRRSKHRATAKFCLLVRNHGCVENTQVAVELCLGPERLVSETRYFASTTLASNALHIAGIRLSSFMSLWTSNATTVTWRLRPRRAG